MKTMITGVRPTGSITLANYIGGIKGFVEQQDKYNSLIFIADIHGLTTYIDPKEIRNNILDITAMYLACGIDINHTALFMQSDVLEHCNLGYLISFQCSVGELNRMTQFKSKKNTLSKNEKDMGLFIYPTLMAADILLYDAKYVPIGDDQKQHLELTRDFVSRFNNKYGNGNQLLTIPEVKIPKSGGRIMSLQDPLKKMSKSDENKKGFISMLDEPSIIRKKIKSAVTDSSGVIEYDPENKPGISNLLTIYASFTNFSIAELVDRYQNSGYGQFKEDLGEAIVAVLEPIQTRHNELINSEELDLILDEGALKAGIVANKTLLKMKNAIGLGRKRR